MQPDTGGGFDWAHAATGLGGGALGTFLTWFWRAARVEPTIRKDFAADLTAAEKRIEAEIEKAKREGEEKVESMVEHFQNALLGIRQQINDIAKESLSREEFGTFREEAETRRRENREDFAKIERKIDQILARHK